MMLSPLTLLAAVALLTDAAPGQQTYRIVLKQPAKDEPALYRRVQRVKVDATFRMGQDRSQQHREEKGLDLAFREQVLQADAGAGDKRKLRRRYSRAERTHNGKEQVLPYAGKTVLIEPKGDRYTFRWLDGAELSGQEELEEEFNGKVPPLPGLGGVWLLPRGPVRVGESWKVDPAPFLKILATAKEMRFDTSRATARGKLLRAYRKDGRQYGVLDVRFDVTPRSIGADGVTLKLKASQWTFRLLLDGCIDGSSIAYRLKGQIEGTLEGTLDGKGMMADVQMRLQSDVFESRQAAGKE